jgi:hypothetical protein
MYGDESYGDESYGDETYGEVTHGDVSSLYKPMVCSKHQNWTEL